MDKPTLLVVDDAPENIDLLHAILKPHYHVKVANGGEKALKIVQSDLPPDLVLLDVMMPGLDGYEVCRQIKSRPQTCNIPVVFVTAMDEQKDEEFGLSLGAVDYVTKPFNASIVLARVKTHLALHDRTVELERQIAMRTQANADLLQALDQLGAARDKIAQSERLAAVGAMVAGVAHELNTPIGTALLAASTLNDKTQHLVRAMQTGIKRSELDQYLGNATQACDLVLTTLNKSASLISSFKRIALTEARSERRRFDLATHVADIAHAVAPMLEDKAIALRLDVPEGITMDSYPEAVHEALQHLIHNARLHGFAQTQTGEVTVSFEAVDDPWIVLRVTDNGGGIPAAHLGRIFDPFFTTKMGTGSNGLGLNVVHNLVTNVLGGSILVTSQPGDTCFALRIPRNAP
ncbi:MAG: hybrid sensor histidine kinase/response regulator [Pseudomonadota bacterium]